MTWKLPKLGGAKRKRIMRYIVVSRGMKPSKHSTKVLARKAARKRRGAKIYNIRTRQRVY